MKENTPHSVIEIELKDDDYDSNVDSVDTDVSSLKMDNNKLLDDQLQNKTMDIDTNNLVVPIKTNITTVLQNISSIPAENSIKR